MACQALPAIANNDRSIGLFLGQRVEDISQIRIGPNQLDHIASLYPADIGLIVEIQCAWPRWSDLVRLKAGLRKDQHLRRLLDAQ